MKWYKYDIRTLTDDEYRYWYTLMSAEKRRRVDGLRFVDDRKRTVVGEMLARKAIAEWCCVQPQDIVFYVGDHGKPYVKNLPIEFNISHSADMVVCAVDSRPIGIDVERVRPVNLKVAKRIFVEEELRYVFGHDPVESELVLSTDVSVLTRFFLCWTAREAYGKRIGDGLSVAGIPPSSDRSTIIEEEYVITIFCDDISRKDG